MAGLCSMCMINLNPCLEFERLERDISTPPQQCHHWQRWLNLTRLAAPSPSHLEVDEPPEVTTKVTDLLQDAGGWKPPQTIGFKDPLTQEGLQAALAAQPGSTPRAPSNPSDSKAQF